MPIVLIYIIHHISSVYGQQDSKVVTLKLLDIEHPCWCISHKCMFIQLFSYTQQFILHTLTWRLVSTLEVSHHRATDKATESKALCIIGMRSPPLHRWIE